MANELGIKNCADCGQELTAENTADFGGVDESNYLHAKTYGGTTLTVADFTKCDTCFEKDIDRHLENQYN